MCPAGLPGILPPLKEIPLRSKDKHTPSSIPDELIDSLFQSCDPKELLSDGGLLSQLTAPVVYQ